MSGTRGRKAALAGQRMQGKAGGYGKDTGSKGRAVTMSWTRGSRVRHAAMNCSRGCRGIQATTCWTMWNKAKQQPRAEEVGAGEGRLPLARHVETGKAAGLSQIKGRRGRHKALGWTKGNKGKHLAMDWTRGSRK